MRMGAVAAVKFPTTAFWFTVQVYVSPFFSASK